MGGCYPRPVANSEHVYSLPSESELAQLIGAATPHFALQARARVEGYAAALPPDHPRQPELRRHLERLDALALEGEGANVAVTDLSPRPSLPAVKAGATDTILR